MDKKTLRALMGSIKKWELIVDGKGVDAQSDNCPLCHLFSVYDCDGCPVKNKTQRMQCNKTPYVDWMKHHSAEHYPYPYPMKVECSTCKRIAKRELTFLKKLLLDAKQKTLREVE